MSLLRQGASLLASAAADERSNTLQTDCFSYPYRPQTKPSDNNNYQQLNPYLNELRNLIVSCPNPNPVKYGKLYDERHKRACSLKLCQLKCQLF